MKLLSSLIRMFQNEVNTMFDAHKLMNNDKYISNIYSIISDEDYAIKALPG